MKRITFLTAAFLCLSGLTESPAQDTQSNRNMEELKLTQEWDKTFPKSDKVNHSKVTFVNRYGITLAADLYVPENDRRGKLPAIAVSGPFGAVKEQSSGLYAQTLAERGFLTIAFDPRLQVRVADNLAVWLRRTSIPKTFRQRWITWRRVRMWMPGVSASSASAAGGGFAINAAANDTRIKATVASTMYDISRCTANGYSMLPTMRTPVIKCVRSSMPSVRKIIAPALIPRTVMNPKPAGDAPQFMKDYYDYYKTERGYHPRSINSGLGWNKTSSLAFVNAPILAYADEIRSAVLLIHGEKAHSRYFSEDAFRKLKGDNKELMIIPGAVHTDLYDRTDIIPFDKLEEFFDEYLK